MYMMVVVGCEWCIVVGNDYGSLVFWCSWVVLIGWYDGCFGWYGDELIVVVV